MVFEVVEMSSLSRVGDEQRNEDMALDTPDWLTICDGATDKSGRMIDGRTGGSITAQLTVEAIAALPSGTPAAQIVEAVDEAYHRRFDVL